MTALERFGIAAPDTTLASHKAVSEISPAEFNERSQALLGELAATVLTQVVPHLEDYPARLHSSGFRVRLLGSHAMLGDLRFHEYHPDMEDRREPWGIGVIDTDQNGNPIFDASIHNHAWGVSSRVIYGEQNQSGERAAYADRMYEVLPTPGIDPVHVTGTNGLFHLFHARYAPGQPVTLEAEQEVMQAIPLEDRRVEIGEGHFIPPGEKISQEWHAPFSPDGLVVTLAFNSHRMLEGGPYVLIGGSETSYVTERRAAPIAETEVVKAKLMAG